MALWMLLPLFVSASPLADSFPFVLPPDDVAPTYVDLSYLNPEPAGAKGFVEVRDGRFYDGAGQRLRFFGSNLTFAEAFPPKEQAPLIAARMRKFGFNVIRIHHIDNSGAPRGLWADNTQTAFDPEQLDRLDYLIAQLKEHGIYLNLNLHVSRNYAGIDYNAIPRTFRYGKVIDHFHPRLIEMQKEYATALLTHVNPYTGNAYAEEPAVAIIEFNNENSLTGNTFNTDLLQLPDELFAPLLGGWREWVRRRYATLEKAQQAWLGEVPPVGAEVLTNTDFTDGTTRWTLEAPQPAEASMQVVPNAGPEGGPALRAVLTSPGRDQWNFQVHQTGLDLPDDQWHTLSFWIRADPARTVSVGTRVDQADWHNVGLNASIQATPEWQRHEFVFVTHDTVPEHTRVSFNFGAHDLGTAELAQVSLKPGAEIASEPGASIDTLEAPITSGLPRQRRDWAEYVAEVELQYVESLRHHIQTVIGARAPVIHTQASYGGVAGVVREAALSSFIDMHAYWQHPRFPGTPWDSRNWNIQNTPMVESDGGGTLSRLAYHRVEGLPYTVSEYDHPAPSFYSAEMFPILAGYGAWQDWDGLFQFNYGSPLNLADNPRLSGYFSMGNHPAKMTFAPIAALLFRGDALAPAPGESTLVLPAGTVPELVARGRADVPGLWADLGAAPGLFAQQRVAVRVVPGDAAPTIEGPKAAPAPEGWLTPPDAPVRWQSDPDGEAHFAVESERVVSVAGRIGGREVQVGPLRVTLEPTDRNFASVALASLDGAPIERSGKLLLVVSGAVINQDMEWNEDFTSVSNKWGTGPTIAEALTAQIALATQRGDLTVKPLDGTGTPQAAIAAQQGNGGLQFRVDPAHQTLWYAITTE